MEMVEYFLLYFKNTIFDYAHDSYRAPVHTSWSRVDEIISEIDRAPAHYAQNVISAMVDELLWSISHDRVFKEIFFREISIVNIELKSGNVKRIRTCCKMVSQRLSSEYMPRTIARLCDVVDNGNGKSEINYLVGNVASHFLRMGHSREIIRSKIKAYLNKIDNYDVPSELVRSFFSEFPVPEKDFRCVSVVSQHLSFYIKGLNGFQVFQKVEDFLSFITDEGSDRDIYQVFVDWYERNRFNVKKTQSGVNKFNIVVCDGLAARDKFSAKEGFKSTIRDIKSVAYAAGNEPSLFWVESFFIVDTVDISASFVRSGKNILSKRYGLQESVRSEYFVGYLRAMNAERFKNNDSIRRCFSTAATAFTVNNKQTQLFSLWSSLESILPARGSKDISIVNNFISHLMPLILIQYVNRMLVWNYYDVSTMRSHQKIIKHWEQVDVSGEDFDKFVALLLLKENEPSLKNLLSDIDNTVIRFRVYQLNKRLGTAGGILSAIEKYKMLVEWQIRRVYRRRNGIVHSGYNDVEENLLLNFNEYWLNAMRRLSHVMKTYRVVDIDLEDSFQVSAFQYNNYISFIRSLDKKAPLRKEDLPYIFGEQ